MYAADEQIIFVTKMCVEGRSAHIRAVENLLHDDRVIRFLSDQRNKSFSQQVRRLLNPPVLGTFCLQSHDFPTEDGQ